MSSLLYSQSLDWCVQALPSGKALRPEEHWRPAQARDLSKYKPRHAMFPATVEQVSWEEHMIKLTK
jgi:hypothetical protein